MADFITCEALNSGEMVAMGILQVVSIPHVSILDGVSDERRLLAKSKLEANGLLSEIHQVLKNASGGAFQDVALEFLWVTSPVKNQPYKAGIDLFVIVRSINADRGRATQTVENLLNVVKTSLDSQKYELKEIAYKELGGILKKVDDSSIKAIVKDERVSNLQNSLLPYCLNYDKITSSNGFDKLVNSLTQYPNCAVSFQLIPTLYGAQEKGEIDRIAQILSTLGRGVMEHGVGNVSYTAAQKSAETYQYYSDNNSSALYLFNVLVFGGDAPASHIAAQLSGFLGVADDQTAALKTVNLSRDYVDKDNNFYPLPWAVNEETLNVAYRNERIWSSRQFSDALYRLPYVISGEEASCFFRLPVGGFNVNYGLNINQSTRGGKTYSDNIINSGDVSVGRLKSSGKDEIGFSLNDLAKHMLVVGTPGSGKTTFSVSLLDRLWKEHHIPFLVIEPAKNEYRALVKSIPDLQVFTPGKNHISPFVFNPFLPPKNVRLETYKSTIKTAFAAAVSMATPLDKIFEEAINNCYSDFRWLDTYTSSDKGKIFNISDFIKCFQETFDEIGYTGDAKNIGRAGVVRLNSLANLFDNYSSIPIEDLLSKPTVIELAAIENADQKALLISLILLSVLSYVNANYVGEGGLKNVILLEEAYVLLDADSNKGDGEANPSAIAQGLIKRMLAEIRSYGIGLIIADQSPRKVSTDVVALTDMKLVFRLVESVDKQIVSDSTNMSEAQYQRMARLKPGEAFFFFNKLEEPEEVVTPDYRLENKIDISLSDRDIAKLSTYWKGKQDKLKPYPQCAYCACCEKGCDYSRRILAREIARRIFVHNFKSDTQEFRPVLDVFGQISALVKAELNDEPFSRELLSCVKLHLWRRIQYGTKIPVQEIQIKNSLSKE